MAKDAADDTSVDSKKSTAVEAPDLETVDTSGAPKHGFFVRLYTGTGAFEVIGRRKMWYAISGVIVLACILSIALKGFTFGIDFQGGTKVSMPTAGQNGTVTTQQVEDVFSKTLGRAPESVVLVGNGGSATVQIRSEALTNQQTEQLRNALFDAFKPKAGNGQPDKATISDSAVSETWGDQITKKALIALGGVPGARRHLHHLPLRAVHGDLGTRDPGIRPRRHGRGCIRSSASRSRRRR